MSLRSAIDSISRPRPSAGSLTRSRAAWLGAAIVLTILLAACGGGDSDSDSESKDAQMFDSEGNPLEGSAVELEPVARSADAAPDFELTLFGNANHQAGEVIRLSQFQGSPVVVNFWFPSCPPCVAEMPDLDASFQQHRADGVEFIGVQLVGLDTARDGQEFVDELGVSYALGADEDAEIVRAYKVTGFPTTVFLDADHNVVRKWTGILDADKLEELVQELLD